MPRLIGYRERTHQPIWNTFIMRLEGCDRLERVYEDNMLRSTAVEFKRHGIRPHPTLTLDVWEIILDFGLPVDPTPIYRGDVFRCP